MRFCVIEITLVVVIIIRTKQGRKISMISIAVLTMNEKLS